MFIDIEGTDGCGKFTQTNKLYEYLINHNKKAFIQSFPNYDSPSSEPVKMYLGGELGDSVNCLDAYQTSTLFAVDRLITMHQLQNKIKPEMYVLFDRYTPSNLIHQSKNFNNFEEMDKFLNWVEEFEYNQLKLPRPDVVIFLDMPPKKSIALAQERTVLKSGKERDIHEENTEYLMQSYERAKYIAKKFNWITINCVDDMSNLKSIDEIHNEILKSLNLIK